MSDNLDLTTGLENIDNAVSTLDSTLTDGVTNIDTDIVPEPEEELSDDIKAKLEKYKQAIIAKEGSVTPESVEKYKNFLVEKEKPVIPVSQFDKEVDENPPTWAQEYSFEKQEDIMGVLDSKLNVENNDYENVDYSYEPFGLLNNVYLNNDNFDNWVVNGEKDVDEHFDGLIDTEVGAQLGATIADEIRNNGYASTVYTEDDRKELVTQIRTQYKDNIRTTIRQKAEEKSFRPAYNEAIAQVQSSNIEFSKNNPLLNRYNKEKGNIESVNITAYNNLVDQRLNAELEILGEENSILPKIYEADIKRQELYQKTVDNPTNSNLAAFLEQEEVLQELRGEVQFGKFLKDANGNLINEIEEDQATDLTNESMHYFDILQAKYNLQNPDEIHSLKNEWLKSSIHVDALKKQLKEYTDYVPFKTTGPESELGFGEVAIDSKNEGVRGKLQQDLWLAQARQEALNHYYLLNHRYLTGEDAKDTYKPERFFQGFVEAFGVSPTASAVMMGTPELTEASAIDILNDLNINVLDEEMDAVELSGGEEFTRALGDMTALIPKLYVAKQALNPLFLGGGYAQTTLGALATSKRLQKYPKIVKRMQNLGKNGLIGSYYKKRVDATGKFIEGLSLKEKGTMLFLGGAMEEGIFQSVGGHTGHGFGFGVGKMMPIKIFGGWQPRPMYKRLFKKHVLGNLGKASSATVAMEAAGITGAFYEVAKYDDTFQEKFNELYGDMPETGKRLMFNLALNSFLGLSEAYNPVSIGNLIRSGKTYDPLTGKRGRNPFDLTVEKIRRDFATSKNDLLTTRNYLSSDPAWGGKGREINKELIEELDADLKYAYDLEKNTENFIGNQVLLDLNSTSAGSYENAIGDISTAIQTALTYKPRGWNKSTDRYLKKLNEVNKKLYGAQHVEFTQKDFEAMAALPPNKVLSYYYKKQDDQIIARAKYLQRYNIIREVPFIDMSSGVESPIYFRITQKRTKSQGEVGAEDYVEGKNVLSAYFVRRGADGNMYRLSKGQAKRLKSGDKKKAQEIFEAEKHNLNSNNPKFIGKGTEAGGSKNIVETDRNDVDQQIAFEKQKSKDSQNPKLLRGLEVAKKLINILPEELKAKFVFHTNAESLRRVINARAAEKRSNAISNFNKGRSKDTGVDGYSETEFRNELIRIREKAIQQTKNPFIVGTDNMIHVDVSKDSSIQAKELGTIMAHELGHPLLKLIETIDPAAYKALEAEMKSNKLYAKKYAWAQEKYTGKLNNKAYRQSLNPAQLVKELAAAQKTILNETMAQWLGEEINASELSGGIKGAILRPMQSFYRNMFGDAVADLMTKGGIDFKQITVSDLSDLKSFKNKIARAIRSSNKMRFSSDIEIPVMEGKGSNEQFNIIGEDAIVKRHGAGEAIYDNLMRAREMRRDKVNPFDIWRETGYYLNNTGKLMSFRGAAYFDATTLEKVSVELANRIAQWGDQTLSTKERFPEYQGEGATERPGVYYSMKLSDLLEGPYKNYYPELKDYKVEFVGEIGGQSLGGFDAAKKTIILNIPPIAKGKTTGIISDQSMILDWLKSEPKSEGPLEPRELMLKVLIGKHLGDGPQEFFSFNNPLGTIIHETQHAIQLAEAGMGQGANPGSTFEKFAGLYLDKNLAARVAPYFASTKSLKDGLDKVKEDLLKEGIDIRDFEAAQIESNNPTITKQIGELVEKLSTLRHFETWNKGQEVHFNQIWFAVAKAEQTAIANVLQGMQGVEPQPVRLPKTTSDKLPDGLKAIFNDLNNSIVTRYKNFEKKAQDGLLTETEKQNLAERYQTIFELTQKQESYYKSNGEYIARMSEVLSLFEGQMNASRFPEFSETQENFNNSLIKNLMETHADVYGEDGTAGYLGSVLDRLQNPTETNKFLPFGKKYEDTGQNITAAPAGSELFIAREKVRTPETYVEYLSKFDKKKTFVKKSGGPQGLGKLYDDKTADKLKVAGEIAIAIQEYNGDVIGKRKAQLDEWMSEAIKYTTFTANRENRSPLHQEFLDKNPEAKDADWEAEIQQWMTVLKLSEFSGEDFQKNWKTNFKAIKLLELYGKDEFKRNQIEGNEFKTGTAETEENIQMALDILEGDGFKKGRRSFLTRLFGGTAERSNNESRFSVRNLNLYGTHNIYSILDDLSINHSESETFKSPLVKFALNRMSEAENDYHEHKYSVLESINKKMREIYEIEELRPEAGNREKNKYQKNVADVFRENEKNNKKQQSVRYTVENPETGEIETIYDKETWSANEAAKLYMEIQDPTNHRGLETMGIMRKVYSLKEQYKTFNEFEKNGPYLDLEVSMVGQGFEGLRTRTVGQAQAAINRVNKLKLDAIQKEFDNKTISSKAKKAKEKIQASAHEKALMQIRKAAEKAYESDIQGGYELTNKGEAIINLAGPRLRQWADYLINDFFPTYSHGELYEGHSNLDNVFRGVYGFGLPRNKKYSPVMRRVDLDATTENIDLLSPEAFYRDMTSTHFKEKGNSAQPLAKQDINNMLLRFVHKMEFFKAYQKPLTDLNNVFNNERISQKISEDFGPEYNKYLNMNLRDFAGKEKTNDAMLELISKVRSNYVIGSLGAKPSLALKQLTSLVAYGADMPKNEFMSGIANLAKFQEIPEGGTYKDMFPEFKKAYETLMDLPYMKKRYARLQFDDALAQVMGGAEFDRVPNKVAYARKRLVNAMMFPVVFGDRMAIIIGGWPKYQYEYNKAIEAGKTEEQARTLAATEFEASTRFAQQASESSDLSVGQRNPVAKMLTMYATSPMSYHRQARAAMRAATAGKGTPRKNVKKMIIYHFLLPQLFQGATNAWKLGVMGATGKGDEVEEALKFSTDIGDMIKFSIPGTPDEVNEKYGEVWKSHKRAGYIGSFNGIFMVKDIVSFMANMLIEDLNFPYQVTPVASPIESAGRNLNQFLHTVKEVEDDISTEDIYEVLEDFAKFVKPVAEIGFGIPASGIGKAIEPAWLHMREEEYGDDPTIKYTVPQPE